MVQPLVIYIGGDQAGGAGELAESLGDRHVSLANTPDLSAGWQNEKDKIVHIVAHGSENDIAGKSPEALATELLEKNLPINKVEEIWVRSCNAGIPGTTSKTPAAILFGKLKELYEADMNARVLGFKGEASRWGGEYFIVPSDDPVHKWLKERIGWYNDLFKDIQNKTSNTSLLDMEGYIKDDAQTLRESMRSGYQTREDIGKVEKQLTRMAKKLEKVCTTTETGSLSHRKKTGKSDSESEGEDELEDTEEVKDLCDAALDALRFELSQDWHRFIGLKGAEGLDVHS